ncbi:MAG TPA: flagellar biosynthetic protein FliR [Bryobacteraceae bacterium]|jgi:flagellar biosynthetic protein FliR
MGDDLFSTGLYDVNRLLGFLLVLARVAGVFVFVPLPGVTASPVAARIVLSFAITLCLLPLWPPIGGLDHSFARLAGFIVSDAGVGMVLGLTVAFATEAMKIAAQAAGLQAGFGYASTIDPNTSADSSLLPAISELFAGLLFFAAGLDRQVLAILAGTLKTLPPGRLVDLRAAGEPLARMGGEMIAYGLRLAFPVIAFLILVDLTLGFLGRVNAQLQLLTLAFPLKIICALGLFAVLAPVYARVYQAFAGHSLETAAGILLRR